MSTEAFGVSIEIENNMSRMAKGDVLNFSIVNKEDTQAVQTFRAMLYKADGTLVADKIVSDLENVNYAPEIAVPELEDGFYYFECTVSDSENELVKLRKEFFVYNDPAAMGSLSSYPWPTYRASAKR